MLLLNDRLGVSGVSQTEEKLTAIIYCTSGETTKVNNNVMISSSCVYPRCGYICTGGTTVLCADVQVACLRSVQLDLVRDRLAL